MYKFPIISSNIIQSIGIYQKNPICISKIIHHKIENFTKFKWPSCCIWSCPFQGHQMNPPSYLLMLSLVLCLSYRYQIDVTYISDWRELSRGLSQMTSAYFWRFLTLPPLVSFLHYNVSTFFEIFDLPQGADVICESPLK